MKRVYRMGAPQEIRAKKDHVCTLCEGTIKKGEQYISQDVRIAERAIRYKHHVHCQELIELLGMNGELSPDCARECCDKYIREKMSTADVMRMVRLHIRDHAVEKGLPCDPKVLNCRKRSISGEVYEQVLKLSKETMNVLQLAIRSEIALGFPRSNEYMAEEPLRELTPGGRKVFLTNTQRNFINLYLRLNLKNKKTCLMW